jgi:hypothetical protein
VLYKLCTLSYNTCARSKQFGFQAFLGGGKAGVHGDLFAAEFMSMQSKSRSRIIDSDADDLYRDIAQASTLKLSRLKAGDRTAEKNVAHILSRAAY